MLQKKLLELMRRKFQRQANSRGTMVGSKWVSCGPHLFASSRKIWQATRVVSREGHPDHVELRRVSGNVEERLILSVDALQSSSQLRPLRD